MNKENNCQCVVCQVEESLLNSLSTQTARTHFQALARRCRQNLVRWAIEGSRHSRPRQEGAVPNPEPMPPALGDDAVLLDKFLQQAQRSGVLSRAECELLIKFKWEGFGGKELAR